MPVVTAPAQHRVDAGGASGDADGDGGSAFHHALGVVRRRVSSQLGEAELIERHVGDIQAAGATYFGLAVDEVDVHFRMRSDTAVRFLQQIATQAILQRSRRAIVGTSRTLSLGKTAQAELALTHEAQCAVPLEFGHVERAGVLAVTTADALPRVHRHHPIRGLVQRADRARRDARRVQALHALPLYEASLASGQIVTLNVGVSIRAQGAQLLLARVQIVRCDAGPLAVAAANAASEIDQDARHFGRIDALARRGGRYELAADQSGAAGSRSRKLQKLAPRKARRPLRPRAHDFPLFCHSVMPMIPSTRPANPPNPKANPLAATPTFRTAASRCCKAVNCCCSTGTSLACSSICVLLAVPCPAARLAAATLLLVWMVAWWQPAQTSDETLKLWLGAITCIMPGALFTDSFDIWQLTQST